MSSAAAVAPRAEIPAVAPDVRHIVPAPSSTRPPQRRDSAWGRAARWGIIALSAAALGLGWRLAESRTFTAEEGAGYWLGIIGGTLLLVQLLYPLRKRAAFMRRMGSAPAWFRLHMVLGIVGPVLILWHCGFSLGDTNSNVTLFAMLVVAVSGVVGRYIYGKVHRGLYGAKAEAGDLLGETAVLLRAVESDVGGSAGTLAAMMTRYAEAMLAPRKGVLANLVRAAVLAVAMPVQEARLLSASRAVVDGNAKRLGWTAAERRDQLRLARLHIEDWLAAVGNAATLAFYERLLHLWHLLHMPLYCLLVVTGIVHVIAVHLY